MRFEAADDQSRLNSHRNKRGPNSASLLGLVNTTKSGRGFAVVREVGCYAFLDMSQNVLGNKEPSFICQHQRGYQQHPGFGHATNLVLKH